jgi:hypothetical protein
VTSTDVEPADSHLSSSMWGMTAMRVAAGGIRPRAFPLNGNTATGVGAIGVAELRRAGLETVVV